MSFYSRRRGGYMGGWSAPSIYDMNPLEVLSSIVSPVLDIVSPFEDINEFMEKGLRWIQVPVPSRPTRLIQRRQQQQRRQIKKKTSKIVPPSQKLPQKYRIVIGKTDFHPSTLRTSIKCVGDNKHLIICSDVKQGRQFKRSFTLPKEVESKKMNKFVTPMGQFVVEFCYHDTPLDLELNLEPKIRKLPEGKHAHISVHIPDFVDPAKLKLQVKGCELIVRFEERVIPCGDWVSRVLYHNRVKLPENTNVNEIKAKSDKHKLTILAPVSEVTTPRKGISQQLREIPIQRKLRHRKSKAMGHGIEKREEAVVPKSEKKTKPIVGEEKGTRKPVTPTIPKTPITEKVQPPITEKPSEKAISEEKPSVAERVDVTPEKQKKKKAKKSKKQVTESGTTEQQLPTTGISSEEERKKEKEQTTPGGSGISSEKGSDILKKVFETGTEGEKGSKTSTTQSSEAELGSERTTGSERMTGSEKQRETGQSTKSSSATEQLLNL